MTLNVSVLQTYIDQLSDADLVARLENVRAWPVYPARIETITRHQQAQQFLEQLAGPDADACRPFARGWLHDLTHGGANVELMDLHRWVEGS